MMKSPWLVTSFEPFSGRAQNVSRLVHQELISNKNFLESLGVAVHHGVLPVTYGDSFSTLLDLIGPLGSGGLILLGEAVSTPTVKIERYAHNWVHSLSPDNGGRTIMDEVIEVGGPEVLVTPWPLVPLLQGEATPLRVSLSAGSYVCNYVYYRALRELAPAFRPLFVHVTDELDVSTQVELLKHILSKLTLSD